MSGLFTHAVWARTAALCFLFLAHIHAQHTVYDTKNFEKVLAVSEDCKAINIVLPRDGDTNSIGRAVKPWTLHSRCYANLEMEQPFCGGVDELFASLQLGTRFHAEGGLSDLEMEEASLTWFSPEKCSFKWYSSEEICQILGRFSHVRLVGDSLTRHLGQALFMLLRDDYKYGALPLLYQNSEMYDKCRCDGQFSEHGLCRVGGMMSFTDQRQYGVCSGAQPFALTYSFKVTLDFDHAACEKDNRPTFILVAGGTHYKHDPAQTILGVIDPIMSEVKQAMLACPNVTTHVAWMGLGAQSRSLDVDYPHQSREVSMNFNQVIAQYWLEKYNVKTFDVWNLTRNAPTSDGYHYLSDVNLVKALYVLNYMDQITSLETPPWDRHLS